MTRYYALNFIRKPEFMGFNGYNDGINRTAFNPLAWGDPSLGAEANHGQNTARSAAWSQVREAEASMAKTIPAAYADAFFELVAYPVEASAAMNGKFLATDLTYLDAHNHDEAALKSDTIRAHAAYDTIQALTAHYNGSKAASGTASCPPLPASAMSSRCPKRLPWLMQKPRSPRPGPRHCEAPARPITPGFVEQSSTVSINAAHFTRTMMEAMQGPKRPHHPIGMSWPTSASPAPPSNMARPVSSPTRTRPPQPRASQDTPWLEYDFTTISSGAATLTLHLLPTFAIDSGQRLRYAVSIDGHPTLRARCQRTLRPRPRHRHLVLERSPQLRRRHDEYRLAQPWRAHPPPHVPRPRRCLRAPRAHLSWRATRLPSPTGNDYLRSLICRAQFLLKG